MMSQSLWDRPLSVLALTAAILMTRKIGLLILELLKKPTDLDKSGEDFIFFETSRFENTNIQLRFVNPEDSLKEDDYAEQVAMIRDSGDKELA